MNLGPMEIALLILAILLLFGYKKLPDASRSLGRSLRIFKGEMKGMKDDDRSAGVPDEAPPGTTPVRGEVLPPAGPDAARLEAEAQAAEARTAELRARARQSGSTDSTR
jgi:sec-independent protein translocase protein TatA